MYIDFNKFNYKLISEEDQKEYVERDKVAYAQIVRAWLESNLDSIVERKLEIRDIAYIKYTSDFIKLLKEAETLYELGFFTSCIALVGISAEDFTKYITLSFDKKHLIDKNQFERLNILSKMKVIDSAIHKLLDDIRKTRNDCLHFNLNFKKKDEKELKHESLEVLNKFKKVIELTIGFDESMSWEDFLNLISQLSDQMSSEKQYIKGFDNVAYRLRNAMSKLFDFDLTFEPGIKEMVRESNYSVVEIDLAYEENGEVTLLDLSNGIQVVVDLDKKSKGAIIDLGVKEGDLIQAEIYSEIDSLGLSASWKFKTLKKP